jgi:diaminopimelate decarboxylase
MLVEGYRALDWAFAGLPHLICYAMKANANLAILRVFLDEGVGWISSQGVVSCPARGAMRNASCSPGWARAPKIEAALGLTSCYSTWNRKARGHPCGGRRTTHARVAVRVNPDVDPKTHPYISTGLRQSKFRCRFRALELCRGMRALHHLDPVGVHAHIGSQITQVAPFHESLAKLVPLVNALRQDGFNIQYLDIGGGIGIRYKDEGPPAPAEYANTLRPLLGTLACTVLMEPGRFLVGNAGSLVTRVLYEKANEDKKFLVVDGGMNDLLRPSLYNAYHTIVPVVQRANGHPKVTLDVVGPICESGDFLAKDRSLPACQPGDLLAVLSAGAYGFAMASNYNARPVSQR